MPKKESTPPARRIVSRGREELRVTLTRTEIEDRRHEAMRILDEADALEAQLDRIKADFKTRSQAIAERLREARRASTDGSVKRDVDIESYLTPQGMVETIRCDTGEVIRTRPASKAEANEGLNIDIDPPTTTEGQAFG